MNPWILLIWNIGKMVSPKPAPKSEPPPVSMWKFYLVICAAILVVWYVAN